MTAQRRHPPCTSYQVGALEQVWGLPRWQVTSAPSQTEHELTAIWLCVCLTHPRHNTWLTTAMRWAL